MNGLLDQTYFLKNSLEAWGIAIAVSLVSYVALKWLQCAGTKRLKKLAAGTKTKIDDLVTNILANTKPYFILALAIIIGMSFLTVPVLRDTHLHFILVVLVATQLGIWGNVAITFFINQQTKDLLVQDAGKATTMTAIGFIGRLILWSLILLLILDNLGFNISTLVTGLGIGGIAVALAVQNILGDLFASLSIVLDKPFVIGDTIQVGADVGTVEYIGLKTTRVKSLSGEQLVYANAELLKSLIRNYKRMQERRVLFQIGVTYDTSLEKLKRIPQIIKEIIIEEKNARFDRCHMMHFNSSSLDFETVYYVLNSDYTIYRDTHENISLAIINAFRKEGIEFAFPTQTLHVQGFPK